MKRNYNATTNKFYVLILLGFLLLSNQPILKAQVSKKPLLELFTSSTCPPCAYANPIIDKLLEENGGKYSLIKYQMDWPGEGDMYYTAQGGVRKSYYSVSGVPDLYGNGTQIDPASSMDQQKLDALLAETTNLEIDVTASINEDKTVSIEAVLNPLDNYEAGLVAHIVVIEKVTTQNVGSNGELDFKNVMMTILPDAAGTTLEALTTAESVTLSKTIDMTTTHMEQANDLMVVVFVQNNTNKDVIQSEMVTVTHPFVDYKTAFNIVNENNELIEGAELYLDDYGIKYSDGTGKVVYEGVLSGTYSYQLKKAGYYPTSGTIEVVDQDLTTEIVMEAPDYYFYEDFEEGIPDTWTALSTAPDYLYPAGGKVIFFKQSTGENPIVLISPEIDLSNVSSLIFHAGEAAGAPNLLVGTVSSASDLDSFEEISSLAITASMEEYTVDFSSLEITNKYLVFSFAGAFFEYFSMDNVKLIEGVAQTYNISFEIKNQNQNVLENATITINNESKVTNQDGYAVFEGLAEGEYNYSVSYEGSETVEGTINVTKDETVNVQITTTAISDLEKSNIEIYPNPAQNNLWVKCLIGSEITVSNLEGKIMKQIIANQELNTLNVALLKNGIYFMQIKQNDSIYSKKILINK